MIGEGFVLNNCDHTGNASETDAAKLEWCTDGCAPVSFSSLFEAEALEQHAELTHGTYACDRQYLPPLPETETLEQHAELPRGMHACQQNQPYSPPLPETKTFADQNGPFHGMQAMCDRQYEHNAYTSDFVNPPVGMHGQHA